MYSGTIEVDGIEAKVSIKRDSAGVVSITGLNDSDVFFATGYAHAQDRLWQLEVQRRVAGGRLSEVFGERYIDADRWMRVLSIYDTVEGDWAAMAPPAKASLLAYAAGINHFLDSNPVLPSEFYLLDIEPGEWSPLDSLAWLKVYALSLTNGVWKDLTRFSVKQHLNEALGNKLFPEIAAVDSDHLASLDVVEQHTVSQLLELRAELDNPYNMGSRYVGSNAWVVAGRHTEHGSPLLANDPHSTLQMPSPWYVIQQQGDAVHSKGMCFVGLPIVFYGQNNHIAWGGANMMADTQDLFIEQTNDNNPDVYRYQGRWMAFEERTEVIKISSAMDRLFNRNEQYIELTVRRSKNGPIVSDLVDFKSRYPIALRWAALDARDTTYDALFKLNYAKNWDEFNQALAEYVAPPINFVYADKTNIGYVGAGRIPVRNKSNGDLPVPANEGYHWRGYIKYEELPKNYNPSSGFIVSANNNVFGRDYVHYITGDWLPRYRALRIENMLLDGLGSESKITSDDMKAIQSDVVNLGALSLKYLLAEVGCCDGDYHEEIALLKQWGGSMEADNDAANLFSRWVVNIKENLYFDELTNGSAALRHSNHLNEILRTISYQDLLTALTHTVGESWCDDVQTDEAESCQHIIRVSLQQTVDEITGGLGGWMNFLSTSDVQQAYYSHHPFSESNVFSALYGRVLPGVGGSENTINVAGTSHQFGGDRQKNLGAGFRQIISLSEEHALHEYMNSTGQSGNIFSPHYDDMLVAEQNIEYRTLDDNGSEHCCSTANELLLIPKNAF